MGLQETIKIYQHYTVNVMTDTLAIMSILLTQTITFAKISMNVKLQILKGNLSIHARIIKTALILKDLSSVLAKPVTRKQKKVLRLLVLCRTSVLLIQTT